MKLRTHLVLLVIATALPIMLFACGLIVHSAQLEREAVERGMRDTARALALALDRDIRDTKTALGTLASSRHLDEPADLRRFYEDAQVVSRSLGGWAVLSETSGRQVINTSRPFGASLPLPTPASLAMMQRVAEGRQPFVSNVIIGTVSRRPAIIIAVPMIRSDRVHYVLDFSFEPIRFTQLLAEAALSPEWIAVVTDRAGSVVARVPADESLVGHPARPAWRAATGAAASGFLKGDALTDADVYAAFTRSSESGWVVGVAAPTAVVERAFSRSLRSLAVGGGLLVAVALGFAFLQGRRLAGPIVALARSLRSAPATAPRRPPPATAVDEVAELQRALDDAQERARLLVSETSARRAAEERANLEVAARGKAEAANQAKDVFLAMLSHELRTPLTSMVDWIKLLRAGRLDAEQTARALEVIDRSAGHQARLIADLLDVSRIALDRLTLEVASVDWPALIAAEVESARPAAEAKSITLSARLDRDAGPVRGDPGRLRQVVGNILVNAIKFTGDGGTIDVRLVREDGARLTVADTGRGIAPDLLPHVFDRFRQADDVSAGAQGLGLGLAIVRYLVEAHGGTVGADSEGPGKGATFTVTLPIAPAGEPGKTLRPS